MNKYIPLKYFVFSFVLLASLSACGSSSSDTIAENLASGSPVILNLRMTSESASKNKTLSAVSSPIALIEVEVTGDGAVLESVKVAAVPGELLTINLNVPPGTNRSFFVIIRDDDGEILLKGQTTVDIKASGGNDPQAITIELKAVQAPVITPPSPITLSALNSAGLPATNPAIQSFLSDVTELDAIGRPISEITNNAPLTFPLGETTVIFSATDAAGNVGTATSSVTVTDQEAPIITVPASIQVSTANTAGVVVNYPTPLVTDDADLTPLLSCTPLSGSIFPLGPTAVNCTATDASGNSNSASFTVTVVGFETALGDNLFLDDDEFSEKIFTEGFTFPYFGVNQTSIFVNSNGNLTFGAGDTSASPLIPGGVVEGLPRISPFFSDLLPLGFSVSGNEESVLFNQFPDRVVITWNEVFEFDECCLAGNTIQVILFNDGGIQFAYLGLTFTGGGIGSSLSTAVSPGGLPALKTVDYNVNTPFSSISGEAIFETFPTDPFDLDKSFLFFQPNANGGFDVSFAKAQDPDGDGLTGVEESALGTNPFNVDSDGDGLVDGGDGVVSMLDFPAGIDFNNNLFADGEANFFTDPLNPDTDGDGLLDVEEIILGTSPILADTDSDGLSDGVETNTGVFISATDTGTDPFNSDTDGDGLKDGVETNTGIFANLADSGSNPHLADTDGDGVSDGEEVTAGTNPSDKSAFPLFVKGATISVSNFPQMVVLGDFDRDGNLDSATANRSTSPNTISVRYGNGFGGFSSTTNLDIGSGFNLNSMDSGDLNGDGFLDLVTERIRTAFLPQRSVIVQLGDGIGGFVNAVNVILPSFLTANQVRLGDLTGNGILDLVVSYDDPLSVISIHLGDGTGNFGVETLFGVGSFPPASVTLGDINGDGNLDLAVPGGSSNTFSVLMGDGLGRFGAPTTFASGGDTPIFVELGDLNGDGKVDLVTANSLTSNVSIFLGDGLGNFAPATSPTVTVGQNPRKLILKDLNLDGKLDIVTENKGSASVTVLLGNGAGEFFPALGSPFQSGFSNGPVTVGDFDNDGDLDLITTTDNLFSADSVSILLNHSPAP